MKILIGADEARSVIETITARFRAKGHDVTVLPIETWGALAVRVAERVTAGEFDQGVVCCWTGTGVSIAANKVKGIRCALCNDAATAAGARKWNDANVLALSLRLLSDAIAQEIVDAWLETPYAGTEGESLACIHAAEAE